NNETELKIKSMLENNFDNITLGHLMSGNLNFPRRINTAYLNASVKDIFISFAENTIKSFKQLNIDIPINILKADGGVMDISDAKDLPVQTIMSGPAASLMGTLGLTNINTDAIILDIGGTTTDIFFLADGIPLFEPTGINIKEYKTLVRSIYSKSIGLGGDSVIKLQNNQIVIGPERKDKAAALGGKYPTPTDALIVLNKTNLGNIDLSNKAISKLANEINLSIKETAKLIVDTFIKTIKDEVDILLKIINSKPVYTIKEILENKELDPKSIAVIGASANAFSSFLEKSFNLEVLIPKNYEVANAIGSALAITTKEINLLINTFLKTYVVPELGINKKINKNYNLKEAEEEALKLLDEHLTLRSNDSNLELEVLESNSFSMVDGFYTKGENIRVKVQVKPGLTRKM
ncbi:MAG TPA: hydantoinase/oxoprolinase family protein, partial [Acholeplasma sp.]|nr:hydantoinase/oxoprolinase family protein [Acholeplasma sp.]